MKKQTFLAKNAKKFVCTAETDPSTGNPGKMICTPLVETTSPYINNSQNNHSQNNNYVQPQRVNVQSSSYKNANPSKSLGNQQQLVRSSVPRPIKVTKSKGCSKHKSTRRPQTGETIVISHLPYVVPHSGNYSLCSNLTFDATRVPGQTVGITIRGVDNVVIDGFGHSIDLLDKAGTGILIEEAENVQVFNLTIQNGGDPGRVLPSALIQGANQFGPGYTSNIAGDIQIGQQDSLTDIKVYDAIHGPPLANPDIQTVFKVMTALDPYSSVGIALHSVEGILIKKCRFSNVFIGIAGISTELDGSDTSESIIIKKCTGNECGYMKTDDIFTIVGNTTSVTTSGSMTVDISQTALMYNGVLGLGPYVGTLIIEDNLGQVNVGKVTAGIVSDSNTNASTFPAATTLTISVPPGRNIASGATLRYITRPQFMRGAFISFGASLFLGPTVAKPWYHGNIFDDDEEFPEIFENIAIENSVAISSVAQAGIFFNYVTAADVTDCKMYLESDSDNPFQFSDVTACYLGYFNHATTFKRCTAQGGYYNYNFRYGHNEVVDDCISQYHFSTGFGFDFSQYGIVRNSISSEGLNLRPPGNLPFNLTNYGVESAFNYMQVIDGNTLTNWRTIGRGQVPSVFGPVAQTSNFTDALGINPNGNSYTIIRNNNIYQNYAGIINFNADHSVIDKNTLWGNSRDVQIGGLTENFVGGMAIASVPIGDDILRGCSYTSNRFYANGQGGATHVIVQNPNSGFSIFGGLRVGQSNELFDMGCPYLITMPFNQFNAAIPEYANIQDTPTVYLMGPGSYLEVVPNTPYLPFPPFNIPGGPFYDPASVVRLQTKVWAGQQTSIPILSYRLTKFQVPVGIDLVDLLAVNLGGKYFLLSLVGGSPAEFYVWYNTGASINPSLPGKTGIQVNILTTDTIIQVASKTAAAINTQAVGQLVATTQGSPTKQWLITITPATDDNVISGMDINTRAVVFHTPDVFATTITLQTVNTVYPVTPTKTVQLITHTLSPPGQLDVITVTLTGPVAPYAVGQTVQITGVTPSLYNMTGTIDTIPSANVFTIRRNLDAPAPPYVSGGITQYNDTFVEFNFPASYPSIIGVYQVEVEFNIAGLLPPARRFYRSNTKQINSTLPETVLQIGT